MPQDDTTKREAEPPSEVTTEQADIPARKPFKIEARKLGLPKEWTSGSVSELLEMLKGPGYRG
jgi:hypothetical protein